MGIGKYGCFNGEKNPQTTDIFNIDRLYVFEQL